MPAILGHAATRVALEQDPTIAGVLALGRRAPVICFGMGAVVPDSVLVQSGFVTEAEQAALRAKGAVGDILSRYIDAEGNIVDPELDARTIGLDLKLPPTGTFPSALRRPREAMRSARLLARQISERPDH